MNPHPADTTVPLAGASAAVPAPAHRSTGVAILTDMHFWVPVIVLGIGLGLLMYIS